MKKLLLTVIASLALCGSILAQETHWPELNMDANPYEFGTFVAAFVQINGEIVTADDPYDQYEIATIINGECRGHGFMDYFEEDGYPSVEAVCLADNEGEAFTFYLFDHATSTLYKGCTANYEFVTGTDHLEIYDWDYDNAVVLNFTLGGISKDIVGYNDGGGWYLISSPVGNVTIASDVTNMVTGEYDLYAFDQEQEKEWLNYDGDAELSYPGQFGLQAGKGYLYANAAELTTITFTSDEYDGEGTFDLDYYTTNPDHNMWGWNLMGNPYNANAAVDRPFYRMQNDVLEPTVAGTVIEAMEGVFVEAESEGETVTFTVAASAPTKKASMSLNLTKDRGLVDRAIVCFGEGRQLRKFQLRESSTKVYIPVAGRDYAIANAESNMGEMPVNFKAEESGSYSLSFSAEGVSFAYLHLIDNMTGADVDLLETPSYSFDASTTDYASRFKLVFATGDNGNEDNFAFFSNGSFVVNNAGEATLQVVDVNGRIVKSETIHGCANVNVNAAPGVYMLRLINGENVKVQKVVVR